MDHGDDCSRCSDNSRSDQDFTFGWIVWVDPLRAGGRSSARRYGSLEYGKRRDRLGIHFSYT